jgi:hypothetical protein
MEEGGTFSILYDDQDTEDHVDPSYMQTKGKFTERLDNLPQFRDTLAIGCTGMRTYLTQTSPLVSLTALYLDRDKGEKVVPFSLAKASLPFFGDGADLARMMSDPEQQPHMIQVSSCTSSEQGIKMNVCFRL